MQKEMDSFSSSSVDIKSPRSKLVVNNMNELLKVHSIHSGNESYINEAFRDDSADSSIQWIFFSGKHPIYQMIFIFTFSHNDYLAWFFSDPCLKMSDKQQTIFFFSWRDCLRHQTSIIWLKMMSCENKNRQSFCNAVDKDNFMWQFFI